MYLQRITGEQCYLQCITGEQCYMYLVQCITSEQCCMYRYLRIAHYRWAMLPAAHYQWAVLHGHIPAALDVDLLQLVMADFAANLT